MHDASRWKHKKICAYLWGRQYFLEDTIIFLNVFKVNLYVLQLCNVLCLNGMSLNGTQSFDMLGFSKIKKTLVYLWRHYENVKASHRDTENTFNIYIYMHISGIGFASKI